LSVGHDSAVGGVDTRVIGGIGSTGFEDFVLCVVGVIIGTANAVKDVFAVPAGVGTGTGLEAESISAHEIVPIGNLIVIAGVSSESVRVDDTTHGITASISAMGVHFTSKVIAFQVNLALVDESNDLDVVGSRQELETGNGALRDEACTVRLSTPGNHFALSFTDRRESS